jgi:hypothetical protein
VRSRKSWFCYAGAAVEIKQTHRALVEGLRVLGGATLLQKFGIAVAQPPTLQTPRLPGSGSKLVSAIRLALLLSVLASTGKFGACAS